MNRQTARQLLLCDRSTSATLTVSVSLVTLRQMSTRAEGSNDVNQLRASANQHALRQPTVTERPANRRRRPVKTRTGRLAIVLTVALMFVPQYAWASGATFGNNYVVNVDGTEGSITATYVGLPPSSLCIVYSHNIAGTGRQLEAGLAVCGTNATIDGTCVGFNDLFSETYISGIGYSCYRGASWGYGTAYPVSVQKYASGSYVSYVNGTAYQSLTGFPTANHGNVWAEETGTTSCSGWSGSARFSNWKYLRSGVWTTVTSATKSPGCWAVSTVSSGAFSVSH